MFEILVFWLLKFITAHVIIALAVAHRLIRLRKYWQIQYGPLVKRPKTPPSHGGNSGSNPLWVTNSQKQRDIESLCFWSKITLCSKKRQSIVDCLFY